MSAIKKWRGLSKLVVDSVTNGSRAVETIQKETSKRPFAILESIQPIALPVKTIHVIHDAGVTGVHLAIRLATQLVGRVVNVALDVVENTNEEHSGPNE